MSTRALFPFVLSLGCAADPPEPGTAVAPDDTAARESASHGGAPPSMSTEAQLVELAARAYRSWRLVDDEMHWAPGLCRAQLPGREHISAADTGAHDDKLFRLWGSDLDAYGIAVGWTDRRDDEGTRRVAVPAGVRQVLVKESFEAVAAADATNGLPKGRVIEATARGACRDCHARRPNRVFGLPKPSAL